MRFVPDMARYEPTHKPPVPEWPPVPGASATAAAGGARGVSATSAPRAPKSAGATQTPLQTQYDAIKAAHPHHLLLYRMGDFYEMFGQDAVTGSKVLGIALTARGGKGDERIPLAGIPHHALEQYLGKLVRAGLRVAICEQTEDPREAKGRVVKREVVRLVTPGTVTDEALLDDKVPNFIAAVWGELGAMGGDGEEAWGLAAAEVSTGSFTVSEFRGGRAREQLRDELGRLQPAELLLPESLPLAPAEFLDPDSGATTSRASDDDFAPRRAYERLCRQFGVRDLSGFGAEEARLAQRAAGALLAYLEESQKQALVQFASLSVVVPGDAMLLDTTTQRSLELVEPLHHSARGGPGARRATLLGVIDATLTPMGGRTLRAWLLRPLRDRGKIEARLDAVEGLVRDDAAREQARAALDSVQDLERIGSRLAARTATPRDLVALRASLAVLPSLREALARPATGSHLLAVLVDAIQPLPDLFDALERGLTDTPATSLKEGGLIRTGYDSGLDELRTVQRDSKEWIARFRAAESERTGIGSLKIGFNRVFGYYIEITRAQLKSTPAPAHYIRRQTLANAERFITDELKEKEDVILHAEERANALEERLFLVIRDLAAEHLRAIQGVGAALGALDVLLGLAETALVRGYVRPALRDDGTLEIVGGRHPVLEALQPDPGQPFVPNDTWMARDARQIALITGPNMAGKSTYIRQVALLVLMGHVGSFVPAARASLCLVDRIFTRVGAMDQLARGQSTFLVEMSETANILNNCTDESLVILDEIGRGTSTYDGLSIAWAVVEFLHNQRGRRALTLFATHYHELTGLEEQLPRLHNLNVAVHEEPENRRIVFLYKIVPGSTDRSYGIHAARMAGLPRSCVERADDILLKLEEGRQVEVRGAGEKGAAGGAGGGRTDSAVQLTLFDGFANHPALDRLRRLKPDALTPLQALQLLAELKREVE